MRRLQRFGRIDILVNNVGYGQLGVFEEVGAAQIDSAFASLSVFLGRYSCNATRFETGVAISMTSCGPIARAGVIYRYIWMNSDACFHQNS
jgi:NAD(P)-dependent dehydrogenase (short-subunit alcohol dehydrogenase family)